MWSHFSHIDPRSTIRSDPIHEVDDDEGTAQASKVSLSKSSLRSPVGLVGLETGHVCSSYLYIYIIVNLP